MGSVLKNRVSNHFMGALFCMLLLISCASDKHITAKAAKPVNTDLTSLKFTVEEAHEWTELFHRKLGWLGADGIFAIPLDGVDTAGAGKNTETMLIFSDTVIGDVEKDSLTPDLMIHNSVAIVKGNDANKDSIQFFWAKKNNGKPESVFIPNTPNTKPGDYFWLGDGFMNHAMNDATYIFGYRVRDTSAAAFGFAEVGNVLIKIPKGSKPPFKDQQQFDTPLFLNGTAATYGSFGAGIFVNTKDARQPDADGYVYVYGVRGKEKNVVVARVKPENFEAFGKWRFWDGNTWNEDIKALANITSRVSNELSVSPLGDGRYAMVFQTDGLGTSVGLRLSNHPQGPFGPVIKIYECPEAKMAKNIFPYNAKAHSSLSNPNELLITYNVNSFDFWNDIKIYPDLYRPRFIRVKLL